MAIMLPPILRRGLHQQLGLVHESPSCHCAKMKQSHFAAIGVAMRANRAELVEYFGQHEWKTRVKPVVLLTKKGVHLDTSFEESEKKRLEASIASAVEKKIHDYIRAAYFDMGVFLFELGDFKNSLVQFETTSNYSISTEKMLYTQLWIFKTMFFLKLNYPDSETHSFSANYLLTLNLLKKAKENDFNSSSTLARDESDLNLIMSCVAFMEQNYSESLLKLKEIDDSTMTSINPTSTPSAFLIADLHELSSLGLLATLLGATDEEISQILATNSTDAGVINLRSILTSNHTNLKLLRSFFHHEFATVLEHLSKILEPLHFLLGTEVIESIKKPLLIRMLKKLVPMYKTLKFSTLRGMLNAWYSIEDILTCLEAEAEGLNIRFDYKNELIRPFVVDFASLKAQRLAGCDKLVANFKKHDAHESKLETESSWSDDEEVNQGFEVDDDVEME